MEENKNEAVAKNGLKIFKVLPHQTKLFWILKIIVLVICIGIVFAAIAILLDTLAEFHIQHLVLSIYIIGFAGKIILCELHLGLVLSIFPYMKNPTGKGIFFILVGIMMLSWGILKLIGIMGIVMIVAGVGFIILPFVPTKDSAHLREKKEIKKRKMIKEPSSADEKA